MEIRIGIQNSPREISFESDESVADIEKQVATALAEGGYLKLRDAKGNLYIVPTTTLGYVEIGSAESRRIGFVG